jgi:hypothetical protein
MLWTMADEDKERSSTYLEMEDPKKGGRALESDIRRGRFYIDRQSVVEP